MCLAVPSKVITIGNGVATIDVYGARKEVNIMLLPEEPAIGDYVLVHAGFAIQTIAKASVESGEVMHESSLALSILDIAAEKCAEEHCTAVDSVRVRIGAMAGVMPDALRFAFDSLKENTVSAKARLVIDTVPVGGRCNGCGREFSVEGDQPFVFSCPLCNSADFVIDRGREMEVDEMEMR